MRRPLIASLVLAAVAVAGVSVLPSRPVAAAPQPSISPVSWELTFRHSGLERTFLTVDGKQKASGERDDAEG